MELITLTDSDVDQLSDLETDRDRRCKRKSRNLRIDNRSDELKLTDDEFMRSNFDRKLFETFKDRDFYRYKRSKSEFVDSDEEEFFDSNEEELCKSRGIWNSNRKHYKNRVFDRDGECVWSSVQSPDHKIEKIGKIRFSKRNYQFSERTSEEINEFINAHLDEFTNSFDSNADGNTFFHMMAEQPWEYDHRIFSKLIDLGFDINRKNKFGKTASQIFLDKANGHNIVKIASILGIDMTTDQQVMIINDKKTRLAKILNETDFNEEELKIIHELISECEIHTDDSFLIDLLENPKITTQHIDLAEILLKAKIDPNTKFIRKYTALARALFHPDFDFMKRMTLLLLKFGADPNLADGNDEIPLEIALCNDFAEKFNIDKISEIISILVDAGANINQQLRNSNTILHSACFAGDDKIVKLLLDKGANPNCENTDRKTPLMYVMEAYTQTCYDDKNSEEISGLLNIFDHLIQFGAVP